MTLDEIKAAVEAGKTVCWMHAGYTVVKGSRDQWLIRFAANGQCIGLTWADGVTLNGKPEDFFVTELGPLVVR